jgi:hypothetical protein
MRTEEKPNEPDRPLAKPLFSEPARKSEPVSVLVSETCSVIVEDEPREPVRNSTRPLNMVMARPSEPPRDLPIPLVWEAARDSDPVTDLMNPLVSRPARENEPVSVLKNPACSAGLVDAVSDPVRVL